MSAVALAIPGGFAELISNRIVDDMSTLRHEFGFRGQVNASDNPLC
jgi:hypothetical protein